MSGKRNHIKDVNRDKISTTPDLPTEQHFLAQINAITFQLTRMLNSPMRSFFQNPEKLEKAIQSNALTYSLFKKEVPLFNKEYTFGSPENALHWVRQKRASDSPFPLLFSLSAGTRGKLLSFRVSQQGDRQRIIELSKFLLPILGITPDHKSQEKLYQNGSPNSVSQNNVSNNVSIDEAIFLNTYPMGVELPPQFHQMALPGRVDLLESCLQLTKKDFKRRVIIAQPHFLFAAVHLNAVRPESLQDCAFIIGGGPTPPSYWDWLSQQLSSGSSHLKNAENQTLCGINLYGLAETGLGVGVGFPTLAESSIPLHKNEKGLENPEWFIELQKQIFQHDPYAVPCPLTLDTSHYFFEEINGELVVTVLSPESTVPLVRYQTGDRFLLGELKAGGGRNSINLGRTSNHSLTSLFVENILYKNANQLRDLTGDFLLELEREWKLNLEIKHKLEALQKSEIASLFYESGLPSSCKIEFTQMIQRYDSGLIDLHRKPRRV